MKQLICLLAAGCMVAWPARPQSAAKKTYRITGVVVNHATGQPLAQARILMNPAGDSSKHSETTTGADGRFAFEGLSAGMWSLYAEHKGFVRQGFGERPGVPDSFTQVVTGAGGASENLVFPLDPPAVVTGKVTDENGEPVPAAIEIISQLETGRRSYHRTRNAATNEQGEFRIWDLPAVPCYLLVVTEGQAFAPSYYSNATDPRAATLLDLKAGQEYRADFILRRSRGVAIRMAGDIGPAIAMLTAEGPQGAEVVFAQLDPGESRSFSNISPGTYRLTLFNPTTSDQSSKRIEVGASDVTVRVPFPDPPAVSAQVQLIGADAGLLPSVTFFLHAEGEYQTHARRVSADGTVIIPGMAPGRYRFMLATAGLYIKSITSQNTRVVDGIVDVPETGTVKLQVVVAGDGGTVHGNVRKNGKPVAPARVVLAPRADSMNPVDYHSYQTETDGSFRYPAIKPADYILFATTDWKLEFGNPAAIRKYLAAGRAVHVQPGSSIEVQIEPLDP